MTQYERAAQLWSVLALSARNHQIISYSTLKKLTGLSQRSVGPHLDPISDYCRQKGLPQMWKLVVSEKTGLPGKGGVGPEETTVDILVAQNRCFIFDWISHECPTPEDFKKAHEKARV